MSTLTLSCPAAVRIATSQLEVRMLERVEAAGRSPTRELLWSWAQQNARVQDLCTVLQQMGHQRALLLFQGPTAGQRRLSLLCIDAYLMSHYLLASMSVSVLLGPRFGDIEHCNISCYIQYFVFLHKALDGFAVYFDF